MPSHVRRQCGGGHAPRTLTRRTSSWLCVARRVRSQRRRRAASRVSTRVDQHVSTLVGKIVFAAAAAVDSCSLLQFCDGREDRQSTPSTRSVCYCTVEFFRITSTACQLSSSGGLGAQPLSCSKRCFACVRLRTSFDSVILSCPGLQSDCGDGWEKPAKRSTASEFP